MPVTPSSPDKSFDPETIDLMSRAFARVCESLRLPGEDDLLTSYVARAVIDMAPRGYRDVGALADAVMQQFEDESVIGWSGERFVEAAHHRQAFAPAAE